MSIGYSSAISSHVGMVRANNQDSGFAGSRLFLVADGMGGHAGGDVASALTAKAMSELDTEPVLDAAATTKALRQALLSTNRMLRATVEDRPELAGMGTTFCGFMTVGDQLALAHIGDSRLYLFRDGNLHQITKDHTFVQRLVDSGRITEEEAKTHPRRSVLMRVLGDVDASPEIDTEVLDTEPGDLWLLCSDGLCGYVEDDEIERILKRRSDDLDRTVTQLIDKSLSHGAPDNVTAVLVEALPEPVEEGGPRFAGSAEIGAPESQTTPTARTQLTLRRRRPRRSWRPQPPVAESHFEPKVDEYLAELIAETKRRNRRRRALWLVGLFAIIALLVGALTVGYQWTQSRYYVGTDGETVLIFQGVQQNIVGLPLSSVVEDTEIPFDGLTGLEQRQVERTLSAGSLQEAREIVTRLGVGVHE